MSCAVELGWEFRDGKSNLSPTVNVLNKQQIGDDRPLSRRKAPYLRKAIVPFQDNGGYDGFSDAIIAPLSWTRTSLGNYQTMVDKSLIVVDKAGRSQVRLAVPLIVQAVHSFF